MTLRPHEILELRDDHFSGGGPVTDDSAGPRSPGLIKMLKAAVERAPREPITASRALTDEDEGCVLEIDPGGGTVDIDLPIGLDIGFFCELRQIGTGTVTITAGAGATINVVASAGVPATIAEQWGAATVEVRAENTWLVDGRLA